MTEDLFEISNIKSQDGILIGNVSINKDHAVFKGHFPGNAILPGASQLNLISKIIDNTFQKNYRLIEAKSLKFTLLINPFIINQFDFEMNYIIQNDSLLINGKFIKKEKTIFKFLLQYTL